MAGKTKCIDRAILFTCIALIFMASAASAQEDKKSRGYKGTITKAELLSEFQNNQIVDGYVIEGNEIISIIKETDFNIKINNSVIKGGLDLSTLPRVSIDDLPLPKEWSEKEREGFGKKRKGNTFHIVYESIEIINSEIKKSQPEEEKSLSINAPSSFFYNTVNFSGTTFRGKAIFYDTTFGGEVDFSRAAFSEETSFFKATFSGWTFFSEATFIKKATFIEATFCGEANFSKATFSGEAVFSKTTFSKKILFFSGATFSKGADFSEVTFSGKTDFSKAIFSGWTGFLWAAFNEWADFSETTFGREEDFDCVADFLGTTFSGEAYFSEAIFSGRTYFTRATFHELAYFQGSRVNNLFLDATLFTKFADFREMTIGKIDYRCGSTAIVKGRIDFRNSRISEALFRDIIFENDVDFSDVKFGISPKKGKTGGKLATVFRSVTFESDANFIRTEFHSDTAFERIKFKGDANFTDIGFKDFKHGDTKKFALSYLTFKHLLLSIDDLPDIQHWVRDDKDRIRSFVDVEDNKSNKTGEQNLQPLTKVLYSLEEVFHSQNNLSDANKAYYYRKLVEHEDARLMKRVDIWSEMEWFFWGLPCNYATSWVRIVVCCGGFYLAFVILYSCRTGGKLTRTYQGEDEFRLRLFVLPIKYLFDESEGDFVPNEYFEEGWGKFTSAIKFSMVIFFKIGYIDTKISGKIFRIDAKWFVWAEWVIGYWLLTALLVTLSNTLPIVHRLISGIF